MIKSYIVLFFFIIFSLSYSRPVLKFGLPTPEYSKDSLMNQKLLSSIFNQLGYDCTFKSFPVERCSQFLISENIDGLPGKPSEELIYFPNIPVVKEPYLEIPFKVYYKNKVLKEITWENLEKYKCVSIIGVRIVNDKMINAVKNKNLYNVATYEQALKMIQAERVDFAILIEPITDNLIAKENIKDIKKFDTLIISTPIYLLLSKKNRTLAPKASKILQMMKKDGSYNKILNEFK